jgi:hypothetical protein
MSEDSRSTKSITSLSRIGGYISTWRIAYDEAGITFLQGTCDDGSELPALCGGLYCSEAQLHSVVTITEPQGR